jgi:hypothetical protein
MSVSVENRRNRLRATTAAVLTVLLLVPFGLLFARYWDSVTERRDQTVKERQGVEYVTRLLPLLSALAEGQATAVRGGKSAPPALREAVNGVTQIDQRLGADLGTRERWADLRTKIDELPRATGGPAGILDAHIVVGDLLLGLFDAVRDKSRLDRDPDNDVSHLQEAIAGDLPEAVNQANRMADLSLLLATAAAPVRQRLTPPFGASVQAVDDAVDALTEHLEESVTDTSSRTLSGNLIAPLDAFRRSIETLNRDVNPTDKPNAAALTVSRTALLQSLGGINSTVLREMDGLLQQRLDDIDADRREAVLTAVAAGLIALLALATAVGPVFRRRRPATATPGTGDRGPNRANDVVAVPAYGHSLPDPVPPFGNPVPPTRREQFGALR